MTSTKDYSQWSFCEPSFVATNATWCLRRLTKVGRKLGGGVDTSSLCGRVDHKKFGGWDLEPAVSDAYLERDGVVCPRCRALFEQGK